MLKSTAAPSKSKFGRKLSPAARAAFAENAEAVRQGKRPKARKGKTKKRGRVALPALAAKAASSSEVPATGVSNEAASIMASVTGSRPDGLCSARTMAGTSCQRPAVAGGRCHLHI